MKTLVIAASALFLSLTAGTAVAQQNDGWLSISELTAKLEAQGFTVREVERDDGRYEVDLTDKGGVRYEAKVDRATGEILSKKLDD